ncbi:MAG TPA: hypothetical protein VFD84_02920 [Candidatus Binatia bacterium]|nr:hypothetical protein [Candidatus Binatia bacterium]
MDDLRQQARQIISHVVRSIDRRLAVEVREVPGQDRLHVALTHQSRRGELELPLEQVLAAAGSSMARHELRLRLKRANDTMLFRPMPDHRLSVKPVLPPGGQAARPPRGRGRR